MRLLSLDVLRAIAVLVVLLCHTGFIPTRPHVLDPFVNGGGSGVDLFFVLSGFLVSGLIFRDPNWQRFLARRAFKLYPAFWCLIAFTAIPQWHKIDWSHVANELLFVQNYYPGVWSHTWSLAVEEHFYAVLPFFLLLTPRRYIPFAAICSMVFCLEMRCLELPAIDLANHLDMHAHMMKTHLRFDALLLGVALQYWFQNEAVVKFCSRKTWLLVAAGIAMLAPTFVLCYESIAHLQPHLFSLKAIGSACLVAAFVARGVPENWLTRLLGYIGRHSYSIYLWHPVPLLLVPMSGWAAVVAYIVASIVVGVQLARLVELPVLNLRERFQSIRQPSPSMASTVS